MHKDKYDALDDMYEIQALFKTMIYAYSYCEEDEIFPYDVFNLIKIIDKKIDSCIHDYDNFITENNWNFPIFALLLSHIELI